MATSSNGAAGSNAGGGSSSPGSSKASFQAARDGKASEPARDQTPTQQQQRAADKVVKLQNEPATAYTKAAQKSANAALSFNVRSEGLPQSKSTVEPKRQPQPSYKAKDGKTYTSQQAITAAQNLDKSKQAANTPQTKKHHAPAPKPPGVARNANRGRSTAQTQTKEQQPKAENDNQKLTAKQQRVLARSLERTQRQAKTRDRNKEQSKGMGR